MMCPGETEVIRFGSWWNNAKTVTASVYLELPAGWLAGAANPGNAIIPDTEAFGVLVGDLQLYFMHVDSKGPGAAVSNLNMYGLSDQTGSVYSYLAPNTSWQIGISKDDLTPYALHIPFAKPGNNSVYNPHGSIYFARKANSDIDYYFFNNQDTWIITTTFVAANNYEFIVYNWSPDGGEVEFKKINLTNSASTATTLKAAGNAAGFYGFVFQPTNFLNSTTVTEVSADTVTVVSLILTIGQGEVLCHLAAPSFLANISSIMQYRVLGCSLDLENVAAEGYKAGMIAGFQAPAGTHYTDWLNTTSVYSGISSLKAQGATSFECKNGIFGFYLANGPDSFALRNFMEVDGGGNCSRSTYPLDHNRDYLIVSQQSPNTGSTAIPTAQNGIWKTHLAFEYMTTTQMRSPEPPKVNEDIFKYAAKILRHSPQWFENETHKKSIWEEIRGWIGSALNWTKDNSGTILKGIETVIPMLSAL